MGRVFGQGNEAALESTLAERKSGDRAAGESAWAFLQLHAQWPDVILTWSGSSFDEVHYINDAEVVGDRVPRSWQSSPVG